MTIIPIHDMILLPGISFYFKKEAYYQWQLAEAKAGDELLFLLQKEQKELKDTSAEDFYPIGFSAEVVSIDADGTVQVKVKERVDVYDIENAEGTLSAAASVRPVVEDISQEEKRAKFEKIRSSYLQFVQNFQWGVWARNIILRWGSLEEMICSSASYLDLSWPEKYEIMETDSELHRTQLIEHAIYGFIEES